VVVGYLRQREELVQAYFAGDYSRWRVPIIHILLPPLFNLSNALII
jgi:hypothetical protein